MNKRQRVDKGRSISDALALRRGALFAVAWSGELGLQYQKSQTLRNRGGSLPR